MKITLRQLKRLIEVSLGDASREAADGYDTEEEAEEVINPRITPEKGEDETERSSVGTSKLTVAERLEEECKSVTVISRYLEQPGVAASLKVIHPSSGGVRPIEDIPYVSRNFENVYSKYAFRSGGKTGNRILKDEDGVNRVYLAATDGRDWNYYGPILKRSRKKMRNASDGSAVSLWELVPGQSDMGASSATKEEKEELEVIKKLLTQGLLKNNTL